MPYPTPAGQRIPYDRDGSAMAIMGTGYSGSPGSLSTAQMQAANDESTSQATTNITAPSWGVVFSHAWDLTGYFIETNDANNPDSIQWSTNTTTLQDGTWSSLGGGTLIDQGGTFGTSAVVVPNYRQPQASGGIVPVTASGVIGVRWGVTAGSGVNLYTAHFYGTPSSGANPDSLRIWQPVTNAEFATVLDFGDETRGVTYTQSFRVKNISATRTATGVALSSEMLTDLVPPIQGHLQFSTDGGATYQPSVTIGTLAPGAISSVIYVRSAPPSGGPTSVASSRIVATRASF